MNTPAKLAVTALGLAAVSVAAAGVGAAVGPLDDAPAPVVHGADAEHTERTAAPAAGGLGVADRGYTLDVVEGALPAGSATLAFRVLGPDGAPVADYTEEHGEDLHLIAVRRDLTGYQHVHPDLGDDGTWRTPLTLTPGSWRVFADTTPAALGEGLVLGADVDVAGDYRPEPLPGPAAVAELDGYTVVLTGEPAAGREAELTFSVSRDGRPVTDLQPYLGAYGHLVALRDGDLAYLHVHPAESGSGAAPAPGPHVGFVATAPSPGTYRLFLDFRHDDVVRTAAFTVQAGPGGTAPGEPAGHGHGG
jgi:hypothetical protein